MTKDDIIKTAFLVWGRNLYRTTSLTEIAAELGVSKPALYRHFKDKDALLDAMYTSFLDECEGFIKEGYDRAIKAENSKDALLVWTKTIADFYIRNRDAFVFSLVRVFNKQKVEGFYQEFLKRGIDFQNAAFCKNNSGLYPSKMQLIMATLIFHVAHFHRKNHESGKNFDPGFMPERELKRVLSEIEDRISSGLKLNANTVAAMNYAELEKRAATGEYKDAENRELLKAVAAAVAEAGPWNASMEMVARNSGLSKSGLYAHFKNKRDMMSQLFITEFSRIVNFARMQLETSEVPEEQLYLGIISIVNYLRSRPEIMACIDWIKTRRLELEEEVHGRLYKIIRDIKFEAIRKPDMHVVFHVAQWVLFMIVNTLALWHRAGDSAAPHEKPCPANPERTKTRNMNIPEVPNESFRILFRFIALGLEGLNDK